jgi:hypothetical protein
VVEVHHTKLEENMVNCSTTIDLFDHVLFDMLNKFALVTSVILSEFWPIPLISHV